MCVSIAKGRQHDFTLFKNSKTHIKSSICATTDKGYIGLDKIHSNVSIPKKKTKKNPLTKEDKKNNREIARSRVLNEHVIGHMKRFHIIADRYRNRRKRFGFRINLISGIYNYELNN